MATKKNDPKKPNESKPTKLTRDGVIKALAKLGIPMASRDDPIYNEGPSTIFVNRRGPSIKKPSPDSASKPTSDPAPRSNDTKPSASSQDSPTGSSKPRIHKGYSGKYPELSGEKLKRLLSGSENAVTFSPVPRNDSRRSRKTGEKS